MIATSSNPSLLRRIIFIRGSLSDYKNRPGAYRGGFNCLGIPNNSIMAVFFVLDESTRD
nr:MAG TPA: hypothetical protein [Bacteriophage sp.]